MATDAPPTMTYRALGIPRRFTRPGVAPLRRGRLGAARGRHRRARRATAGPSAWSSDQDDCEFPLDWSDTAVRIVASKYFRYGMDDPRRERSLRQVIDRVVDTIRHHGAAGGYFADDDEAETFAQELRHILVTQKAAFNSPVWFNCGVDVATREHDDDRILDVDDPPVGADEPPVNQASACFILSVNDTMPSIQRWIASESEIFRGGSGAGVNLSRLRGDGEPLSNGGQASGPVSFMRWADSGAGSIKSGGGTRRAAKMVILDADHPDILEFVRCKAHEEAKAYALGEMGYDLGLNGDAWRSIQFQNANNSVRLTDDFFRRVEAGEQWQTRTVASGEVRDEMPAADLLREISEAAWACGDPGVQYEDTIQRWHTSPNAGPHLGLQPVQRVHAHRRLGLQPGLDQPDGVPRRGRHLRGRRLPPRGAGDAHRPGDHRHAGQLPDQADRRQRARLPPARPGLHQPRLAADVPGPGVRLRRRPRVGRGDHRPACRARPTRSRRAWPPGWAPTTATRPTARRRTASCGCTATRPSTCPAEAAGPQLRARCARPPPRPSTTPSPSASPRGASGAPGYRNAQVSVIAPTGTISFMMDAQTTGIEPAIGLISYKTLVGGGYMKLVNTDVERALAALGYDEERARGHPRPRGRHRRHRGRPGPRRRAPAGVRLRLRRGRRAHDRARRATSA